MNDQPWPEKGDADFSPCGLYRYRLRRNLGGDGGEMTVCWVLLNPSTADAQHDDPTIRRCIRFSKAWGYGRVVILNIFAFRATDPRKMYAAADPIGPDNDKWIYDETSEAPLVVCAWGTHGAHRSRANLVVAALGLRKVSLHCLGRTKAGFPRHPLYLRGDLQPVRYP